MRTITEEKTLYKFEELSKEAQEIAFINWSESQGEFWNSQLELNVLEWELEDAGFENPEIRFSGFWSQGDGASFTANVDIHKFFDSVYKELSEDDQKTINKIKILIDNGIVDFYVYLKRDNSFRYVHEKTVDTIVECDFDPIANSEKVESIYEYVDFLEYTIEQYRLDWCHEIYNRLEMDYEYSRSEELFQESYIDDHEFLEDGTEYL